MMRVLAKALPSPTYPGPPSSAKRRSIGNGPLDMESECPLVIESDRCPFDIESVCMPDIEPEAEPPLDI